MRLIAERLPPRARDLAGTLAEIAAAAGRRFLAPHEVGRAMREVEAASRRARELARELATIASTSVSGR